MKDALTEHVERPREVSVTTAPTRRTAASLRKKILDRARELAHSGHYAGHAGIIAALTLRDAAARKHLEDWKFRSELDWLCRTARDQRRA